METELKNLRIDRTSRRAKEPKPVVQLLALAIILVAIAVGGLFAYQKINAPVPVQTVQVQSPMNASAALRRSSRAPPWSRRSEPTVVTGVPLASATSCTEPTSIGCAEFGWVWIAGSNQHDRAGFDSLLDKTLPGRNERGTAQTGAFVQHQET